jgi:hypothetical protein
MARFSAPEGRRWSGKGSSETEHTLRVKGKVVPVLNYAMKAYGGVDV